MRRGDRVIHPLAILGSTQDINRSPPVPSFPDFIRDKNISARIWPKNPDSYIIIMAGPDHMYGTEDDVTNFR